MGSVGIRLTWRLVARRTKLLGLTLSVAALTPVLAACDTSPGAAAIVGGDRIPISTLQTQVRQALTNPQAASQFGADRAEFTRQVLAQTIQERIIDALAAARHITVTPRDVAAQLSAFEQQAGGAAQLRQQAAQGGVSETGLQQIARAQAQQAKIGEALVANLPVSQAQLQAQYQKDVAQFDQVHVAHILVTSRSLATHLLAQVKANPSSFAALAKRYSIDTQSKGSGGDLGYVGRGQTVTPFDRAIFGARPGSFLLVHSQYGYHVVHVIARRTESLQQATPQLKQELLSDQRSALLQRAIVAESRRIGVHVNPRYGTWDPQKQAVAATKSPVSSPG